MTITDPTELGTILSIWAHPDDEAYLAAGIMAVAVDSGQRVVCVTATRGELGTSDPEAWPPDRLAAARTAEMEACMARLGITEHTWLDHPDGGCADVDPEVPVGHLTAVIAEVRPDTVLTFGPDGMTGHPDHMAVSHWTAAAFERAAPAGARLYYATKSPEWNDDFSTVIDPKHVMMIEGMQPPVVPLGDLALYFRAEGELLERKVSALNCQASQIEPLVALAGEEHFRTLVAEEFFRSP